MTRPVLLLLAATLLPIGLVAPAPTTQRQEVLDFLRRYADAANRDDITTYLDMYAERPDLVTINDGQFTRGWDAMRDEANQMMGTAGTYRISVGSIDFSVARNDASHGVLPHHSHRDHPASSCSSARRNDLGAGEGSGGLADHPRPHKHSARDPRAVRGGAR